MKCLVDTNVILDIAFQAYSARQEAIPTIVTRNENDFEQSGLDVYSPSSFLQSLQRADG